MLLIRWPALRRYLSYGRREAGRRSM